jgi:hypothetical protein
MSLYLIPNLKPITSKSGMIEHAAPAKSKAGGTDALGKQAKSATDTAG